MTPVLEPAAQALADASSKPPFLYELGVADARQAKLRSAGVDITTVRYDGAVHDFMLLDSVADTRAGRAATAQAAAFLRAALHTG